MKVRATGLRRWLWALLAAGVAAAVVQAAQRAAVEGASRQVELVADYEKFAELARREGIRPLDLLIMLRNRGAITSVGVPELTLQELRAQGRASLPDGWQLSSLLRKPYHPRPGAVYVALSDADLADWVERSLRARLGPGRVARLSPHILEVMAVEKDLSELGLGFRAEDLTPLAQAGLLLVPRLSNSPHLTETDIRQVFADLEGQPVSTVIFAGRQVLGFPDHLETTARELERRGISLGVVETDTQLGNLSPSGMEELRALAEGRMVRVFSVPEWLLTRRTPDEVVDAALRAVEERNARLVYLRPMVKGIEPFMEAEQNGEHLEALAARLRARGFALGPAQPFAPLTVPLTVRLLGGLAVLAGGVLLVELALRPPAAAAAALLGAGGVALAGLTAVAPGTSALLLALGAAVIFPALGLAVVFERWRRLPAGGGAGREAVLALLLAGGVALVGGLLIAALLGERSYLLEWTYFHGVKAALLLPPLLGAAAFLGILGLEGRDEPGWRRLLAEGRCLAELGLRFKHAVALGAFLGVVALLLIRSGNAPTAFIPALELKMRALLEEVLVARPRTKEFLFGHPALMLAAFFYRRGERLTALLLAVAGSLGLVSLVNSFEHLRTPVLFSLLRSLNGLALGLLAGAAATGLVQALWRGRAAQGGG